MNIATFFKYCLLCLTASFSLLEVSAWCVLRTTLLSSLVTRQLDACPTLHLLCKAFVLSIQNSLLELGLPLTSDRMTGFFSITSTLDGERKGDSPKMHHNIINIYSVWQPSEVNVLCFILFIHQIKTRFTCAWLSTGVSHSKDYKQNMSYNRPQFSCAKL